MANAVSQVEPCNVSIKRDSGMRTAIGFIMSTTAAKAGRLSERTVLPIFCFIYIFYFILYHDKQTHNYFTNYHTPTFFNTTVSSSRSCNQYLAKLPSISNAAVGNTVYN